MCGLFGFYGNHKPDVDILREIAGLAAKRGCDGWGVVTEFSQQRDLGRLKSLSIAPSRMVIGHCRLATVLDTKRKECCQPLHVGRFVVAHNGAVGNVAQLRNRYGFDLKTGVDSEAIGHVLTAKTGDIATRLTETMAEVDSPHALVVWDQDTQSLHMRASGMPLYRLITAAGVYWCSIQPDSDWNQVHGYDS